MITYISATEAKPRLAEYDVIIDIRTQKEWDDGRIQLPTVRFVESLHQHPEKIAELSDIVSKKVLLHCGSGRRAAMAAPYLESFTNLTIVNKGGYSQLV